MSTLTKAKLAAQAAIALRQMGRRQVLSLAGVAASIAVVRSRKKLELPRPASTAIAFVPVPLLAVGFPRSKVRDGLVWGAHMWSYKNAFEIPHDAEQ